MRTQFRWHGAAARSHYYPYTHVNLILLKNKREELTGQWYNEERLSTQADGN
jgi:hypothetical protein